MNFADLDMLGAGEDRVRSVTYLNAEQQQEFAALIAQGFSAHLKLREEIDPVLDAILTKARGTIEAGVAKATQPCTVVAEGEPFCILSPQDAKEFAADAAASTSAWVGDLVMQAVSDWYAERTGSAFDFSKIVSSAPAADQVKS